MEGKTTTTKYDVGEHLLMLRTCLRVRNTYAHGAFLTVFAVLALLATSAKVVELIVFQLLARILIQVRIPPSPPAFNSLNRNNFGQTAPPFVYGMRR
jgi:hypothetical protein